METVAFLGMGRMGRPMAQNLLAAGFAVRVWNRTPGKAPPEAAECRTPREAVQGAAFAVSMLADDNAVLAAVLGPDGLLAWLRPGAVHVGMSTVSTALAQRLADAHRAAGQQYVAAPVFGRPEAAEKKALWIVAGGEAAAVERCRPLFAALGQGTFPMGTAVHASLAKLCGNFLIASTIEALAEALALAEKAGMDPKALVEMLGGTLFGSPIVKGYGPRIAATEFEPAGFAMPLGLKDVKLALKAGEELNVPLPLASLARDHLLAALARGRGGWDWAGFASAVREQAGLPPVRKP